MGFPDRQTCPACGGAGGGPFGRANSGWDVETYECVRCEGRGYIQDAVAIAIETDGELPKVARPGIAKVSPDRAAEKVQQPTGKRRSSG